MLPRAAASYPLIALGRKHSTPAPKSQNPHPCKQRKDGAPRNQLVQLDLVFRRLISGIVLADGLAGFAAVIAAGFSGTGAAWVRAYFFLRACIHIRTSHLAEGSRQKPGHSRGRLCYTKQTCGG